LRRVAGLTLLALTACTSGQRAPAPEAVPTPAPTPLPTAAIPQPAPLPAELPTPRARVSLEGTVTYLQRIALTPEAVVQVELRDATVPEAPGPPIAKQVIQRPGQVPVAFSLSYEPGSLLPGHRYVVSARISDRGQLQFVTEQPVLAVPKLAGASLEIVVVPVQ
jgi:putative lipoprotein